LALDTEDYPTFEAAIDRCIDIVKYLDETLDRRYEISRELSPLYEFFTYDLLQVKLGRNKPELERLRPMFADLRDAFQGAERNQGKQAQG
ncbi:MAG: flagellar protein FliS, partial [Oscillospiraceae bacterium]|nr:flagellar protein FliS [Oscillospiraceae bacterium]